MKLYVASSWRNERYPEIVTALREAGHEVYDFRHPAAGDTGFHWSEIDPDWQQWTSREYIAGLLHPLAQEGFRADWDALMWAEGCVLVLPCGRSAHLEAGVAVGQGKPLFILLDQIEPELMYKMATGITDDLERLLDQIKIADGDGGRNHRGTERDLKPLMDTDERR